MLLLFRKSYFEYKGSAPIPRLASILAFIVQLFKETNIDFCEIELLLPGILKCLVLISEPQGQFVYKLNLSSYLVYKLGIYCVPSIKLVVIKVCHYFISVALLCAGYSVNTNQYLRLSLIKWFKADIYKDIQYEVLFSQFSL